MAKVTGPLYSMSASGKIGNAMVFFPWKGINAVRQWVVPANPMTPDQGDVRVFLGGTGRAVGFVKPGFTFAEQLVTLGLIPSGQTKQSYMVKYIIDHFIVDAAGYSALLTAYTGHSAYSSFESQAATLGLIDFSLPYASVATFPKGLGLYLLADLAIQVGFTGTPYTTALASWVSSDITAMIADFTT